MIIAPIGSHPQQAEPVFSTRQDESVERGQFVRVTVYYPDATHDFEEEHLGNYGDWIASEIVSEAEERCTRKLRRRLQAKSTSDAKIISQTDTEAVYR
jgi:hypothetical protein